MIQAEDDRHRYGEHYTPESVARLLAAFAIRSAGDTVLDPSCGDGRLLEEAERIKRSLSDSTLPDSGLRASGLFGIERSPAAVEKARASGANILHADFFEADLWPRANGGASAVRKFNAIIGNPPYIRQEILGSAAKRQIAARLKEIGPDIEAPRWSGRSDIFVYFFALSAALLEPKGRLVFLTASSWLDAGYGAALREFLLRNFRIVAIIGFDAGSLFKDASINTVVTVLEREPDAEARAANNVRFVRITAPLDRLPAFDSSAGDDSSGERAIEFARGIEQMNGPVTGGDYRIRTVSQDKLQSPGNDLPLLSSNQAPGADPGAGGWGRYLRAADVFFAVLERGSGRLSRLSDVAHVRFGLKTGANDFFYVRGHAERMNRLSNLASVRRGLTTGANDFFYLRVVEKPETENDRFVEVENKAGERHLIESEFLAPVIFSLKELPSIRISSWEPRRLVLNCNAARHEIEGSHCFEYITRGEEAGYHRRPTCSSRDPWYRVLGDRQPAPLIFPSKVGERWLVAINEALIIEDKKLYGIFPRKGVSAELLAALLNSTWARYYTEMTCRQMVGAQAIADIDVAVAEQILLPDPALLDLEVQSRLVSALNGLAERPIVSIFDEVNCADRRLLDEIVLEAIGFVDPVERIAVRDEMYGAAAELVKARLARSQ